jgi:rare lipoprotein A
MGVPLPARATLLGAALAVASAGCTRATDAPEPRTAAEAQVGSPNPPDRTEVQTGNATWYGGKLAGRRTASGEIFDPSKMTAAHRTLPFGTWVEVKRVDTGQTVRVRITDRGPFGHADRIIDLARGAAEKIDLVKQGVTPVELRIVDGPTP